MVEFERFLISAERKQTKLPQTSEKLNKRKHIEGEKQKNKND